MANPKHLEILKKGVDVWNKWREENPRIKPDLFQVVLRGKDFRGKDHTGAELYGADLRGVNLSKTNLQEADLIGINLSESNLRDIDLKMADLRLANLNKAKLRRSDLRKANLTSSNLCSVDLSQATLNDAILYEAKMIDADLFGAELKRAYLVKAYMNGANLKNANLTRANLTRAVLIGANLNDSVLTLADLTEANLMKATIVEANLYGAILSSCSIYGISAWNSKTNQATKQENLVITNKNEPVVTVDDLKVAQFIYMLLHNENIRSVIDTIGEKGVLILGRFIPERKSILEAIRNKLRELGFVPMMFDFEKPTQRDFTETIKTLAGISRFIIADITNPKSAPLELQATMPDYMIPFVPIIHEKEQPFSMFRDLKQKYGDWVLDLLEYNSTEELIDVLDDAVVQPALDKAYELIDRKAADLKKRHVRDYRNKI